jgi:hypothetical protein
MPRQILCLLVIMWLNAFPLSAIAQERPVCDWGNIDIANLGCDQPQRILKKYRNAATYAEHQSLMAALNQLRNTDFKQHDASKKKDFFYDSTIDEALMYWLDWYQVAFTARDENRQLLDNDAWRRVITLAHRDPYAAIIQLNKTAQSTDKNDVALRLLLIGMLSNRLNVLAEAATYAAYKIKADKHPDQNSADRLASYIEKHKKDYNIGETCYGGNYNGRHFSIVEKQFPQSRYAGAAAYLSMAITPCGECEGVFSCYLSRGLSPTEVFLLKYPESEYAPMLLKRSQNLISAQFSDREARADYMTKNDPKKGGEYDSLDAAKVLIDFEKTLNKVAAVELISTKFLLSDLYLKLKQTGNAKRILNWLSAQAPDSDEHRKLSLAIKNYVAAKSTPDVKEIAARKKRLVQRYWRQECEIDKAWLGQESIRCQDARLSQ